MCCLINLHLQHYDEKPCCLCAFGFMEEKQKYEKKNEKFATFSFRNLSALNKEKYSIMHVVPFTAETVLNIICAHSRHVDSSFYFSLWLLLLLVFIFLKQ